MATRRRCPFARRPVGTRSVTAAPDDSLPQSQTRSFSEPLHRLVITGAALPHRIAPQNDGSGNGYYRLFPRKVTLMALVRYARDASALAERAG